MDTSISAVREMTFWDSCDAGATQLTASDYNSEGADYQPSEDDLPLSSASRDLCYMFHDFQSEASQKLKNIRGDASIAAIRIQLSNG